MSRAIQKPKVVEIDQKALEAAIAQWNEGTQDMQAAFKMAVEGDLSKLTIPEKLGVYVQRCVRMGIDPSTKPFDIIKQTGKEVLYANSVCAAELRKIHNVTLGHPKTSTIEPNMICVSIEATLPNGRKDADMGVIEFGKGGLSRGDAVMKAITKAKRRVTFSILGMPEYNAEPGDINRSDVEVEVVDAPDVITDAQRKRLWAINTNSGRDEEFLRSLLSSYGIESTSDIPKTLYEEICTQVESVTPPGLE
jgi:hypothetical protein